MSHGFEEWAAGPATPEPSADALQLWRAPLVRPTAEVAELRRWLDETECARADRFVNDNLTSRFIAGRAFLRGVLARYLGVHPTELRFEYGPQGKPSVSAPSTDRPFEFNLSHSGDIAVLGVISRASLGVDVERRRPSRDLDGIARRYFSPAEDEDYRAQSPPARVPAFYRCWTRKEAYLKAKGGGLSAPLDRFRVTLRADEPPRIVHSDLDPPHHPGWTVLEFDPGDNCTGAAVIEGGPASLSTWTWSGPTER